MRAGWWSGAGSFGGLAHEEALGNRDRGGEMGGGLFPQREGSLRVSL